MSEKAIMGTLLIFFGLAFVAMTCQVQREIDKYDAVKAKAQHLEEHVAQMKANDVPNRSVLFVNMDGSGNAILQNELWQECTVKITDAQFVKVCQAIEVPDVWKPMMSIHIPYKDGRVSLPISMYQAAEWKRRTEAYDNLFKPTKED